MTVRKINTQENDITEGVTPAMPSTEKRILLIHFADVIRTKTSISSTDFMKTWESDTCEKAISSLTSLFDQVYVLFKSSKKDKQLKVAEWLKSTKFLDRTHLTPDNAIYCESEDQVADIIPMLGITHVIHPDIFKAAKYVGVRVVLTDWSSTHHTQLLPEEKKFITRAKGWADVQAILTTGKSLAIKEV